MFLSRFRLLLSALALMAVFYAAPADAEGQIVPNFDGTLLSGEPFKVEDHIGKDVIVLNFFTTDCAPCRVEMPALDDYYAKHKQDHIIIVGVDVIESSAVVEAFVKAMGLKFPVLVDGGELTKALGVTGYPTTITIGVDGKIQFRQMDPINVPVILDAHLMANGALEKEGKSISREVFLKQQEDAGLKPIHVVPPSVKPVEGSAKDTQKDEIFDIKVAHDSSNRLDVDVDYYYSGDHGTTRVYIDCDPHMEDGGAPFGMLPAVAEVGRHTAHAPLTSYEGTPEGALSTEITCVMASRLDSAQMAKKTVPYKKTWSR